MPQTLIFKSFGFTSLETLLYSMPMYAVTFTGVITSALLVNKWPRLRFPIAIFVQLCTMSALLVAGVGADKVSRWGKFGAWTLNLMFSISHFIVGWPIMSWVLAGRVRRADGGPGSTLLAGQRRALPARRCSSSSVSATLSAPTSSFVSRGDGRRMSEPN